MNRRRAVLFTLLCAPVALSHAQPSAKVMRVGLLRFGITGTGGASAKAFTDAMRELGWIEGKNVVYDIADAESDESRLPELAAALVARRPDVIYVSNGPTARAAAKQTRTIPIVFSTVPDPVEAGLVKSLSQPGGNVTGVATFGGELGGRRMQILKEVLPRIRTVGVLMASSTVAVDERSAIEKAAGSSVKVIPVVIKAAADLDAAFAALAQSKPDAVFITQSAFMMSQHKPILQLAAKYQVPVVGFRSNQAEAGALMSYNSSLADHARRAAQLVDRVLRGAKPADIPVELPTTFELVINMKTAKALGITIPQSVLLQASRVIE